MVRGDTNQNQVMVRAPRTIFTNQNHESKPSHGLSHHEPFHEVMVRVTTNHFHEPKTTTKTKLFFVSSRIISLTKNTNKNQVIFRLITNHFTKLWFVSPRTIFTAILTPNHHINYHQNTKNLNHWFTSINNKN